MGEDWTSVSDIGKVFDGVVLLREGYLAAENAYVESARRFARESDVKLLTVADLEPAEQLGMDEVPEDEVEKVARQLRDGQEVSGDDLDAVVRANLRELIWCRLVGPRGFCHGFGYDYYMYVAGIGLPPPPPLPEGMFAERVSESQCACVDT